MDALVGLRRSKCARGRSPGPLERLLVGIRCGDSAFNVVLTLARMLRPKDLIELLAAVKGSSMEKAVADAVWSSILHPGTLAAAAANQDGRIVEEILKSEVIPDQNGARIVIAAIRKMMAMENGDKIMTSPNSLRDQLWSIVGHTLGFEHSLAKVLRKTEAPGLNSIAPNTCYEIAVQKKIPEVFLNQAEDEEAGATAEEWIVALAPVEVDGKQLVAGGSSGKVIRLYDVESLEAVKSLEGHENTVCTLSTDPIERGVLWSGSDDQTVRKWSVGEASCLELIGPFPEWVVSVIARSVKEATPATISTELLVSLVNGMVFKFLTNSPPDFATSNSYKPFCTAPAHICSAAIAKRGEDDCFFIGCEDHSLYQICLITGCILQRFVGHSGDPFCIHSFPSGEDFQLVSASYDKTIRAWSSDGSCLTTFRGHTGPLRSCTAIVNPSQEGSNLVASCSSDGSIRVWDIRNRSCISVYQLPCPLIDIISLQDGTIAASNSLGQVFRFRLVR